MIEWDGDDKLREVECVRALRRKDVSRWRRTCTSRGHVDWYCLDAGHGTNRGQNLWPGPGRTAHQNEREYGRDRRMGDQTSTPSLTAQHRGATPPASS